MTSNSATLPVADWHSASAAGETYREARRVRPRSQPEPEDYRTQTVLDPLMQSPEVEHFESALRRRLVGQDRAIRQLARVYQVYLSGLSAARPSPRQPPSTGTHRLGQDAIGRSNC